MRVIALLPLVALVATPPASVGPAGAPAHARSVLPPVDADRICARFISDFHRDTDRGRRGYGRMARPLHAPPAPMPPPPPPPSPPQPPPSPVMEQSRSDVAAAHRVPPP